MPRPVNQFIRVAKEMTEKTFSLPEGNRNLMRSIFVIAFLIITKTITPQAVCL